MNQAIGARRSYLWKEFDYYLKVDCGPATWDLICKPMIQKIIESLYQLKKDLYFSTRSTTDDDITQEMIQKARDLPVAGLLEWANGRSRAWCHEDLRPSLYVAPRINKVICPVCNKKFDTIDVIMNRDGINFRQAVLKLCQIGG